jgi:hypothetical protein
MKRSSSGNAALIQRIDTSLMDTNRRPASDFLELERVLLLVQGAILVATTIEAVTWRMAFAGASVPVLLTGGAAVMILIARARLRVGRGRSRRFVYAIEGFTLAFLALDLALAIALTGTPPPAVALLTRLVLPLSVIYLIRQSARTTSPGVAAIPALEGTS